MIGSLPLIYCLVNLCYSAWPTRATGRFLRPRSCVVQNSRAVLRCIRREHVSRRAPCSLLRSPTSLEISDSSFQQIFARRPSTKYGQDLNRAQVVVREAFWVPCADTNLTHKRASSVEDASNICDNARMYVYKAATMQDRLSRLSSRGHCPPPSVLR